MISSITSIWALFLGIALITIGHGLQGTLLGVRGVLEGFSTGNMGIIMSCYYGGFLLGSLYIPRLVQRVGHIRVFAAFASLASVTILAHSIILDPFVWGLIRIASGFSFAGLFVVAESWLNDQCTRENRGRMLSIYMGINHGGFLAGQVLLNLAAPEEFTLFILISILLSLALVPILITASPAPSFDSPTPVSVRELYRISPTGMMGAVLVGIAHGAVWGMGPVFAHNIGLDVSGVSLFMGAAILGGFLFQWPIGNWSDTLDRRSVLHTVTWLSVAAAGACVILEWLAVEHLAWGFLFSADAPCLCIRCASPTPTII